ncbi:KilA-N domain-containing protein [Vibrio fluvialis]|uniref:KilA-N domain-containing protein n=1 Tax=Vibrio sp. bablab_jr001 TaxID=2755067 RepID=UPI0018F17386|nr:KilA-N domain-containing protein [Vibrio sp. bablab_jr001]EKO3401439.1 KilA-N domain-containing protein [Vibrio fluvialis]EKO3474913.1 KilA-N domain-containing protein [Vibrio fluvialis]MBY8117461.1 KilA-N domain-containing protein [Vibrio fluvialis]MBY8250136.1 KilA-N domain-containing protein [Vibrio fluvialis]MBY8283910.1 KilA-N domain-containing protein [Vibrio fluvialis]
MTKLTILSKGIRTLDNLYSLNDLHKASGNAAKHQPSRFLRLDTTQELIAEIVSYPDLGSTHKVENGKGTWVCKELVYAYAMWISARFHLQVIHAFDAITSQPQFAPSGVTLTAKQARFLQCAFSQFDELKARHGESYRQYQTMQQQINMMRSFCDHMESELKTFRSQVDAEVDAINHINLYKGMVLEYQGADELKRFIEQKH